MKLDMKSYVFIGVMITHVVSAAEFTFNHEMMDFHSQGIYFGNVDSKIDQIDSSLEEKRPSLYSVDLSDNNLDDTCLEALAEILTRTENISRIEEINLTNNRISLNGLQLLSPLLLSKNFKRLIIPINSLDMRDISEFLHTLESLIKKQMDSSKHSLFIEVASKIIWLPESYDFDHLPLTEFSREAHKKYYHK